MLVVNGLYEWRFTQLKKGPESQSFGYCVGLFEETRTGESEAFIVDRKLNCSDLIRRGRTISSN